MIYTPINNPHATAVKNGTSPSRLTVLALSTNPSPTANLNRSHVAGESIPHPDPSCTPFILRASRTAARSAKNTELPKNSGGSPIPFELCTLRRWCHDSLFPSLSARRSDALKTCGMSLKPGIL